ncbi:hypothetical protein FDECE_5892 [Fusarium decemcellulare]|nr:hypothetical protein FDECE_5892 [Fusarium decemcellulare]
MPCCIAVIQYLQCRHSNLFKIGCTSQCEGLCPPSQQQTLLISHYLWSCEDCHQRYFNRAEDDRCNRWANRSMSLASQYSLSNRQYLLDLLRTRELYEDRRSEMARVAQVEEIQWVAEWTLEYGLMIFDVLYKRAWVPEKAADRIVQLRDLRLWDLVVVKDALRDRKELMLTQSHESFWIVRGSLLDQQKHRKQAWRPPIQNRPPPPLFSMEETDEETDEELDRTTPRSMRDSSTQTDLEKLHNWFLKTEQDYDNMTDDDNDGQEKECEDAIMEDTS